MTLKQYPITFPSMESFRDEDFVVTPLNEGDVSHILSLDSWSSSCLIIFGEAGAGKTHLLNMWGRKHNAVKVDRACDIGALLGSENQSFAVDSIENWIGDETSEHMLFHLYNHCKLNDLSLLLTSEKKLVDYNFIKADLSSRLKSADYVILEKPDDIQLKAILVKLFSDHQLQADIGVVDYIVNRCERSIDSLRKLVYVIDHNSLAEKRRITIPFVREILDQFSQYDLLR